MGRASVRKASGGTKISCHLLPAGGSLGWRDSGMGLGLDGGAIEMLIKKQKTQPSLRVHGPGSEE